MSGHDFGTVGSGTVTESGNDGGTNPRATVFPSSGFASPGAVCGGYQPFQQHAPPTSGIPPQFGAGAGSSTSTGTGIGTRIGASTPAAQGNALPSAGASAAAPLAWASTAAAPPVLSFAPSFGQQQQQQPPEHVSVSVVPRAKCALRIVVGWKCEVFNSFSISSALTTAATQQSVSPFLSPSSIIYDL